MVVVVAKALSTLRACRRYVRTSSCPPAARGSAYPVTNHRQPVQVLCAGHVRYTFSNLFGHDAR